MCIVPVCCKYLSLLIYIWFSSDYNHVAVTLCSLPLACPFGDITMATRRKILEQGIFAVFKHFAKIQSPVSTHLLLVKGKRREEAEHVHTRPLLADRQQLSRRSRNLPVFSKRKSEGTKGTDQRIKKVPNHKILQITSRWNSRKRA